MEKSRFYWFYKLYNLKHVSSLYSQVPLSPIACFVGQLSLVPTWQLWGTHLVLYNSMTELFKRRCIVDYLLSKLTKKQMEEGNEKQFEIEIQYAKR